MKQPPYLWTIAASLGMASISCNQLVASIPLPEDRALRSVPVSGRFSNEATLIPVAPHTFLFVQPDDPKKRFSFTTHTEEYDAISNRYKRKSWHIEPETMLTTGSSVPRFLWGIDGLGPLDFTKSAIIHDWLFEAHHRWQIAAGAQEVDTMKKYQDYAASPNDISPAVLEMDDAADIMVEAIKKEMGYNQACIQALDTALSSDRIKGSPTNAAAGLKELKKSFRMGRENPRKLHEYSFAIRTPFAKHAWEPPPQGDPKNIKQSPHNSTVEVIRVLSESGDLDRAVTAGAITPETAKKLRQLVIEKKARDNKIKVAEAKHEAEIKIKVKESESEIAAPAIKSNGTRRRSPSIGAVYGGGKRDYAGEILGEVAGKMGAKKRDPHQASKSPSTTEVRFYHYPEDKAGAEEILEILKKKGIEGRISLVTDKTQIPGTYQIAFGNNPGR